MTTPAVDGFLRNRSLLLVALLSLPCIGCGTGGDGASGAGGSVTGGVFGQGGQTPAPETGGTATVTGGGMGTGGQVGTGGQTGLGGQAGTGAQASTGGRANTGGQAGTGGQSGSGGQAGSGDQAVTGGQSSGTGGRAASGGRSGETGGQAGTGGRAESGGQAGTGGRAESGGQAGSGGQSGTGGQAGGGATGNGPRRLVLCDEGNKRVIFLDFDNPSTGWHQDLAVNSLRDIQLVGGNRLAVSISEGYVELDLTTGEVKKEVTSFSNVESIRRLPNGNTVLGSNIDGVTLQEVDADDQPVPGHDVAFGDLGNLRILRRTPQGTFLLGVGSKLAEVNWDEQIVWDMTIPGGDYVYQGLRLADGNMAVTSGYGAALVVLDPAAKSVQTAIGGKDQPEASAIQPNFYAGFQILPNGHFVVTNWEGHGSGNGSKGIQLLEYDATGALVWKWKQDATLVSSLHHVIVLDGLDTTKLHDDVGGVLAPVTQ